MKKIITFLEKMLLALLPKSVFGVRAQGEKLPEPTFKTTEPETPLSENEWNQQFRVSSLHKVHQHVYLG